MNLIKEFLKNLLKYLTFNFISMKKFDIIFYLKHLLINLKISFNLIFPKTYHTNFPDCNIINFF